MASVIVDGKLYQDVKLVNSAEEAEIEVIYDKIRLDKKRRTWVYSRRGYVVATAEMN